jgi:hypothetical protein
MSVTVDTVGCTEVFDDLLASCCPDRRSFSFTVEGLGYRNGVFWVVTGFDFVVCSMVVGTGLDD